MKRMILTLLMAVAMLHALCQTSWKGTVSTSWATSANWTNGVPNASVAAIIGDASFTGNFQPGITTTSSCAGLTLGGTRASTLTVGKNFTVSGGVTINGNGTLNLGKATLTVSGNWTNNGAFSTTANQSSNIFSGTATTISGTTTTTFKKMTINANCVVTANTAFSASSGFTLNGTLVPAATVTIGSNVSIGSLGTLKVTAANLSGNYTGSVTLNGGSTVEYNSSGAQTVATAAYSTLRIAGSGTRTLAGNITNINSSATGYGNLYVDGGTLDLAGSSLNRGATTTGGTLSIANGATLRLSGSNFPSGYNTNNLSLTSTVDYYGAAEALSAVSYGNLLLSGSGTKTFPASAVTVSGNLTTSGTVTAVAGAALTVAGALTIGAGTTFDGGAQALSLAGGVANSGSFTQTAGSAGTVSINGPGTAITGAGTYSLNNLSVYYSGTTCNVTTLSLAGNLATIGSGVFTHSSGTLAMSGTGKSISGANIILNNLTVTGTVTAGAGFTLTGNLAVSNSGNSLSFAAGTILVMSGTSKTISGAGTISFATLSATGSISTASSFGISNILDVTGSLTATAGTATFSGISLFNGSANLYNVTIAATDSLQLAANSTFGIAGAFTISTNAIFDATSTKPNYVVYNGSSASTQNVTGTTYDNLTLSNSGTKAAAGAVTVATDLTIATGTTFSAGAFTHTVQGNWNNNGSFSFGTSTVQFTGGNDATLTGATSFNVLTINKTNTTNSVFLANNMSTPTLNMSNGVLRTQTNKITITGSVSFGASAYIRGTIERSHSFSSATDYAFESAANVINFTGASSINNVTVTITQGSVSGFPFGGAVNRSYAITHTGSFTAARLRLHYEDAELNGNQESALQLFQNTGSAWTNMGVSASSTSANYAEKSALTSIAGSWTLSDNASVVRWTGATSSNWNDATNWTSVQGTPSLPPGQNDIVQIGTAAFTNQPTISTAVNVKSIIFGSAQAATLTLAGGGSLVTQGNISGSWSANATHTLAVGAQSLTVNGDLTLSDGTSGHSLNLSIGSGSVSLTGTLTQKGNAAISFSGAGSLSIGGDFSYTGGSFTPGSGTVTYNGGNFQAVGSVTYNQLVINKTAGTATTSGTSTINADLSVLAGTFDFSGATTITGNVNISAGAAATNRSSVTIGGNWNNNGNYIPNGGFATFNGTGSQTIKATSFNKIIINKASGTATLLGSVTLNSDLIINAGTLDLAGFTANRNTIGGTLQLDNGATLIVGGTNNFPQNYTYYTFGAGSNTLYNGTGAQTVYGTTYGNLTFSNGGATTKTLGGTTTVAGDLLINSGATLDGGTQNLNLSGHFTNSGSFTPSSGAVLLNGSNKNITGNVNFNRATVYGSYTVAGGNTTYNGILTIISGASYDAGSGNAVLYGNLTNSGSLTSSGTTTFAGTTAQTIRLINAINSASTGVINFNGTVAPTLNSTSTPTFATLNINNTDAAGIAPSVNWTIYGNFTVASGATFKGGNSTHTIYGNFTNNGVVSSTGALVFVPATAKTAYLGGNSGGNTFSSTGSVTFGGSGALSVTGTPTALSSVIIGNTAGVSPAANWSGISGTFTINSNALFNAGSNTYTLSGDMESNGTLNGGTSSFVFNGTPTPQISGSPNTTFYDVTVNSGTTLTVNSEFNVDHNMTINGAVDANLAGFVMTGATAGTITGAAASLPIVEFSVEKSNATVTLAKPVTGSQVLTITSGTLDIGTNTLTQDATNAPNNLLEMESGSRLRIDGSNALPAYSTYSLDSLSVVEYYGTGTQALTPGITYGSIEIKAGTKTTTAALTIAKNVTISGGSFQGGNFTHAVGGNWTQTGGSYTAGTGTIQFNGLGQQTVTATDAFNNISINNTSNIALGGTLKVAGTLDFTAGKLVLGAYDLLPGAITNAGANSYVIATGTGALRRPVATAGSQAYPVGTTTAYTPVTVAFDAASVADSVSARIKTGLYNNGESGTALTNYGVNATWVLERKGSAAMNATLTMQWPASLELPAFSRSSCRLAHYTGGAWSYGPTALTASGTNPYTVSRGSITSFSPFSVRMNNAALPVTLVRFAGERRNGADRLSWSTASESNSDRFEMEQSIDGNRFSTIATVAAAGNSSVVRNYEQQVNGATGTRYYRLRLVDLDGRYSYSNSVRLTDETSASALTLNANPVHGNATLQLQVRSATRVQLTLHDGSGRLNWSGERQLGAGSQSLVLPTQGLAAGVYYLNAWFADGSRETIQLVKD